MLSWIVSHRWLGSSTRSLLPGVTGGAFEVLDYILTRISRPFSARFMVATYSYPAK